MQYRHMVVHTHDERQAGSVALDLLLWASVPPSNGELVRQALEAYLRDMQHKPVPPGDPHGRYSTC